jgi:GGDEF domain-containing protein
MSYTRIELPSSVVDQYRRYIGSSDDSALAERLAELIQSQVDSSHGDVDGLTGCGSHFALVKYVNLEILSAGNSATRFAESSLCCDIDNFMRFVDYNGFGRSDEVLVRLARRLMDLTPAGSVYRFGGDEFVVRGIGSLIPNLDADLGVTLKQAIVTVDVSTDRARHHRVTSWVMLHLHRGVVESSVEGVHIHCNDRPEWAEGG